MSFTFSMAGRVIARPGRRAKARKPIAAPGQSRYKAAASEDPNRDRRAATEGAFTMAVEQTLSIIKPDATRRNLTGAINARLEAAGLRIVAQKRLRLSREQAERFYEVHKERPFYDSLCSFMTSGPVVVQVLEADGAVALNREVMGATNPADAAPGTIRADFAESLEANSVHGSDSPDNARREVAFFFSDDEIVG
jgi:nucleoside-diphosphate kinase